MVRPFEESLRMRHKAKDSPAGIADAGDVIEGAIRIGGIGALRWAAVGCGVSQRDLPPRAQPLDHTFVSYEKLPFAMPHGKRSEERRVGKECRL